jgi:hypothetical protein
MRSCLDHLETPSLGWDESSSRSWSGFLLPAVPISRGTGRGSHLPSDLKMWRVGLL